MPDNDGKLDAKEVAELLKEWQKEISVAYGKVETAINNIGEIRSEIREATKQISDAKAIYDSSWKCFLVNHWWKAAILLGILYFLIDGKKWEGSKTSNGDYTGKIEDLKTPNK